VINLADFDVQIVDGLDVVGGVELAVRTRCKKALEQPGKSILITLVLAVLNMLPLPPLDGGRVAVGLLPRALALSLARLERWGLLILIGGLFLLPMLGRQIGLNLDVFHWLIWVPVSWLLPIFAAMAGLELG
jgi:hypothetical protein